MGEEDLAAERIKLLKPYQVNKEMLANTGKPKTIVLHCLPAVKGNEITHDVLKVLVRLFLIRPKIVCIL